MERLRWHQPGRRPGRKGQTDPGPGREDMKNKVLIVTFEMEGDHSDLEHHAGRIAAPIANVPGLIWKLWITNPEEATAGGIYLFASDRALNDFVDGPIAAEIVNRSGLINVSMKVFEIMAGPSRRTRAPLEAPTETDYQV